MCRREAPPTGCVAAAVGGGGQKVVGLVERGGITRQTRDFFCQSAPLNTNKLQCCKCRYIVNNCRFYTPNVAPQTKHAKREKGESTGRRSRHHGPAAATPASAEGDDKKGAHGRG